MVFFLGNIVPILSKPERGKGLPSWHIMSLKAAKNSSGLMGLLSLAGLEAQRTGNEAISKHSF